MKGKPGTPEGWKPLVLHHEHDEPLQSEFLLALGRFMDAYARAEVDLVSEVRNFIAWHGGKNSFGPLSEVVAVLSEKLPVAYLLEAAEALLERRARLTKAQAARLKECTSHMEDLRSLRNLLAHQPADLDPFSEVPFVAMKRRSKGGDIKLEVTKLQPEVLVNAAEDITTAVYLYRDLLYDPSSPAWERRQPWRYTRAQLLKQHLALPGHK